MIAEVCELTSHLLLQGRELFLHDVAQLLVGFGCAVHEPIDLSRDTIAKLVSSRYLIAAQVRDVVI